MAIKAEPMDAKATSTLSSRVVNATVIVTSLGYFVDIFDFFLYNMLRQPSLSELGLAGGALTDAGLMISNCQMAGALLGAIFWGVLGDKFGRKSSLFASILVYSLASLACSFVQSVDAYAFWRFLTGFGIAGEVGAGITLVAERLDARRRGLGMALFISAGAGGVIAAMLVTGNFSWRTVYLIGGCGGLMLMAARALLMESGLFAQVAAQPGVRRGDLALLWRDRTRRRRFFAGLFVVAPGTFGPQIVWTLSPEIAASVGVNAPVQASVALGIGFGLGIVAELIGICLSEYWRSRLQAIRALHGMVVLAFVAYLAVPLLMTVSAPVFLALSGLIGFGLGIWTIGIATIAEQFGTNLRATVTTMVPNFSRGLAILMNLAFAQLHTISPVFAVAVIGTVILALAFWGSRQLEETYGRNLDYVER